MFSQVSFNESHSSIKAIKVSFSITFFSFSLKSFHETFCSTVIECADSAENADANDTADCTDTADRADIIEKSECTEFSIADLEWSDCSGDMDSSLYGLFDCLDVPANPCIGTFESINGTMTSSYSKAGRFGRFFESMRGPDALMITNLKSQEEN